MIGSIWSEVIIKLDKPVFITWPVIAVILADPVDIVPTSVFIVNSGTTIVIAPPAAIE